MIRTILYSLFALFGCFFASAQSVPDTMYRKALDEVVVTGTRTENKVSNIPLPIQVISAKTIRQSGSQRLIDILQMQTGLMVASNPLGIALQGYPNPFGDGIQMQGLDPSYTLIMIDGEPLTGRNAGIINLGRIVVGNIRQIEILKGPATSLYGSDALAGVINIITETPSRNSGEMQTYYGTNNTLGLTASANVKTEKTAIQLFAKRYSSDGYDFDKDIYGKTIDPFTDYAFNGKFIYNINDESNLLVSARYSTDKQRNNYLIYPNNLPEAVGGNTVETDKSIFASYTHKPRPNISYYSAFYATTYTNNASVYENKSGSLFEHIGLKQLLIKPEIQVNIGADPSRLLIGGIGYNYETVNSTRYSQEQKMNSWYVFGQKQLLFGQKTNMIVGARFDKNDLYSAQVSPKIAVAHKFTPNFIVKGSIGTGFKAPDFRQQFLNFENSMVSYTIIGAREIRNVLTDLKNQGLLDSDVNIDPYLNDNELKPEKSVGVNLGFDYTLKNNTVFKLNLFRNDISNLIESFSLPFVAKNGQGFFSYMNVNKVYTEGAELNISHRFNKNFNAFGSYQFLEAKDKEVLEKIRNKQMYKRNPETNVSTLVTLRDYKGLFNRSRHSGNLSVRYANLKYNASALISGKYRGKLGYDGLEGFRNGNDILDDKREFIDGFALVNATVTKNIGSALEMQAGVENVLNYTNKKYMPGLFGRSFFINCNLKIK